MLQFGTIDAMDVIMLYTYIRLELVDLIETGEYAMVLAFEDVSAYSQRWGWIVGDRVGGVAISAIVGCHSWQRVV